MKRKTLFNFALILVGSLTVLSLASCTGGGGGSRAQIPALTSSGSGPAVAENNEGVDHLVQGHYDVAVKHFKKALASNPNFAEAHFNLAVSLDGQGKHGEATESFKKAKELGGDNPKIAENAMLKKHLKS